MIVKIMKPAGTNFPGVDYNDNKIDKGKGELMLMKNFPSFINENSNKQQVRDYLKAISKSNKVQKPQFHAVISTKFQEHSKEDLTGISADFMAQMGYGQQPYIAVFHKDTENNHIHIVSTRVDKQTGKKIDDSYEKLKAQKALAQVMEKRYGINEEGKINQLLNYKIGSFQQLKTLLNRNGYQLIENTNDGKSITISKNGIVQRRISADQIVFSNKESEKRIRQIRAIFSKYRQLYSNKVFRIDDYRKQEAMLPEGKHKDYWKPEIEFESELQKKLRDSFGVDIVFHHKDNQMPFGYTLIDHKTATIYKGSEIMKMGELFEFTSAVMDKRFFEQLKDYGIPNAETRMVMLKYLNESYQGNEVNDFMLFENKKLKNRETFNAIRSDVKEYLKSQGGEDVILVRSDEGKYYAIHSRLHFVGELQSLIGEKQYQQFLNPEPKNEKLPENSTGQELKQAVNEMLFEWMKSSGTAKDPAENELKKRKKKR
ncbi:mobilization protein [Chryseobacterium indologenes]|uniref:relaxase/mobilization nuclease domain-containing protein n=1 Tax=Chryseobacterium indologenes TaxID=253 RepID=UPI000BFE1BE6|nr:relaxase/mobilization nuclease domain-containing protein [Chryseobacterium indologenes]ATN07239.1 mobilization protein [Chryseobacterium indologenes]AYY84010.1 mobilization protein [Chryseobacterium indologenes]QIX80956.1 relaxase/mobilization nuclease domain-containing protein [Chryseobacterium indologenes]UDQ54641.1 relaxase/mobilization nuclease domain-containing protein [Chryseobacterium indologenes]